MLRRSGKGEGKDEEMGKGRGQRKTAWGGAAGVMQLKARRH